MPRRIPAFISRFVTPTLLSVALVGCSSLSVTRINSDQKKPNNVWVFFTVQDGEEPVAGLAAEDFTIYEDDQEVSVYESRQVILNPDVAAVMYTMLLLDMSGSVTESGQTDALVDAAQLFMEKVGQSQKVGVYAFDGGEKIHSVVPFTDAKGSVSGGLEGLREFHAKDPSTNLNGAVVLGLGELEKALAKDKRPLKFGTLVVFSDGTDRAARVSDAELDEALASETYVDYQRYAIGVGAELEDGALQRIGRDGTEMATDDAKVTAAFEVVAERIENQTKRFYLLSYCTPARNGEHRVRIEANAKDESGKSQGNGALEYTFDAEGFGPPPQCDPQRKPTFDMTKNLDTDADANVEASAEVGTK